MEGLGRYGGPGGGSRVTQSGGPRSGVPAHAGAKDEMSRRPGKTLTGRSRPILAMIKTVSAAPAERVVRSRLIHLVGGRGCSLIVSESRSRHGLP
jgi:hypothetical protein